MAGGLSGILLVDKPEGWTSHDVVGRLRRLTGQRRIGHSGTLDPMATGLLVVFLGRATRAVEFAEGHDKAYTALLRPGLVTDTLDTTGRVLESTGLRPTRTALEAVLPAFRGEIEQLPPMYSAIKQGGKKLYEIARAGGQVERKPRRVTIYRLECTGERGGDFELEIECSKGTYIRTLCDDIGRALGCGACMSGLRRTRAGGFRVEDALTLEEIELRGAAECLLPVDALFAGRPIVLIKDERTEKALRNGADVKLDAPFEGECRVYSQNREFLLLGAVENGVLHTIKSFFEV